MRQWHRLAAVAIFALLGCSKAPSSTVPPGETSDRMGFIRDSVCATCLSRRSSRGTDALREVGDDLLAPAFLDDQISRSEIAKSGLLSESHVHDWIATFELINLGGGARLCGSNPKGSVLARNLMEYEGVRECVRKAIEGGNLTREHVEAALQVRDGSRAVSEGIRESYARVVSIARESKEWAENYR